MEYKNENTECPRTLFVEQSNVLSKAICLRIGDDEGVSRAVHLTEKNIRKLIAELAVLELELRLKELDFDEQMALARFKVYLECVSDD